MFRITRGMHVQHVRFPFPLLGLRNLDQDADDGEGNDADPPHAATPPAAENTAKEAAEPPGQE